MDLLKIPIVPPPLDVVSNFIGPISRAPLSKGISMVDLGLMVVFVMLRIYLRVCMDNAFTWLG